MKKSLPRPLRTFTDYALTSKGTAAVTKIRARREYFVPIIQVDLLLEFAEPGQGVHVYLWNKDFWQGWFASREQAERWIGKHQIGCRKQHKYLLVAGAEMGKLPVGSAFYLTNIHGSNMVGRLLEPEYGRYC